MDTPAVEAAEARRHGLERRRSLSPDERRVRSDAVQAHLGTLPELGSPSGGTGLATYLALPEEVDLTGAAPTWVETGWELHLPRLDGESLVFVPWHDGDELHTNAYGIAEPVGEGVAGSALAVVLLPCVALDAHGTRVGFGAGYYDRALAGSPRPLTIGVAFEAQRLAVIERRPWDVPLDVVVTDAGVFRPGR